MGCDIHLYVEYTYIERKKKAKLENKETFWYCFGGHFNPGRNYTFFGYLFRGHGRHETDKGFEGRGLPEDAGFYSMDESRLFLTEDGKGENEATLEQAKKWGVKLYNNSEGKPTWCDHPDWHSHSWLTTKEFAKAMKNYEADEDKLGGLLEYKAILAAMKTLEKSGDIEARIVFWFDN